MNIRGPSSLRWHQLAGRLGVVLLLVSLGGRAEIVAPYTPDLFTLHLWHLNEPAAPLADAVTPGLELRALEHGATLGNESFIAGKKFGTALGTYVGNPAVPPGCAGQAAGLSARPLQNHGEIDAALNYAGADGAFTYEAIVRVDFDPAANFGPEGWGNGRSLFMQLLCADAAENVDRVFQFRLVPIGSLNRNTQPLLEFINLNQGRQEQSFTAAIPTNGPDAIRAGNWYHVAVSYNGQPDQPHNLRFYWTRLETRRTAANLIGTGRMTMSLPAGGHPAFTIGQTGRPGPEAAAARDNFVGLLDEVRLSSVARSASEMLFAETALTASPARDATASTSRRTRRTTAAVDSARSPETSNATAARPAAATTEAAVDNIRRRAEAATVVAGATIRGPLSNPRLALLFSCRTTDASALALLQTLKALQVPASFFVSSPFLNEAGNRQLVQTMLADGHYVGPQSDTWTQLTQAGRSPGEPGTLAPAVESHLNQLAALGVDRKRACYFLPTSDQLTSASAEQAQAVGLKMVAGTSGTLSFAAATAEGTPEFVSSRAILESILQLERRSKGLNGFLLLFPLESGAHRTDIFYPHFKELIQQLREDGYQFVRVDELLETSAARQGSPALATFRHP